MYRTAYKKFATSNLIDRILFHPEKLESTTIWFIETHPGSIKNISLIPSDSQSLIGESAVTGICNGAWDIIKKPFSKHILYKTTTDIINGIENEQTSVFKKVKNNRITHTEAIQICEKIRRLIDILQENGYKSQYELGKLDEMQRLGNIYIPQHETKVGLDRNGELIRLMGGRHRLAVAQQIGIKRMPAILSLVHSKSLAYLPEKHREITGNPEDFRPFD